MARRQARPAAPHAYRLEPYQRRCPACGGTARVAYHDARTVATLDGLYRLTLVVRRCHDPACPRYPRPYRPQGEGGRGLADAARLRARLATQGRVILAIDGLQPDVGHAVLWVLRDCLSGEVLLARSLLGGSEEDLVPLLREVAEALPVPVAGVISDGQTSLRNAVRAALPRVPHQLCQFHYLREAAKPIFEADRHAKVLLKKEVRGVRPHPEGTRRALEGRAEAEAEAVRGYCLAVRSA